MNKWFQRQGVFICQANKQTKHRKHQRIEQPFFTLLLTHAIYHHLFLTEIFLGPLRHYAGLLKPPFLWLKERETEQLLNFRNISNHLLSADNGARWRLVIENVNCRVSCHSVKKKTKVIINISPDPSFCQSPFPSEDSIKQNSHRY